MGFKHKRKELSPLQLICLTISSGGLQLIWTTIMSQGSPYLSSLGLPASIISLVWLAGPLSGAIVQPYIGILSDSCTHSWGRRRPFIVFGTLATIICTLALPRSEDLISLLLHNASRPTERKHSQVPAQILATIWIWGLNIFIQPVQAGIRALIVDSVPVSQQVQASAYASSVIGVGSILGYSSGFLVLPSVAPWFGDTQFKGLSVIASVALGSTAAITCLTAKERVGEERTFSKKKNRPLGKLIELVVSVKMMPKKIARVFMVQFFAWLAWFPFLFYITTYVGEIYISEVAASTSFKSKRSLRTDSIRYGTLAMILFAMVALLTNLILPHFVSNSSNRKTSPSQRAVLDTLSSPLLEEEEKEDAEKEISETDQFLPPTLTTYTHTAKNSSKSKSINLCISWLTLPRAWVASHILMSTTLLLTSFTDKRIPTTLLVGILGISWALTQWAPFALISSEIARLQAVNIEERGIQLSTPPSSSSSTFPIEGSATERNYPSASRPSIEEYEEENSYDEEIATHGKTEAVLQTGTIIGLHNNAIATPQMIAAVLCSFLFWILNKWDISGGQAVGWVIRIVGCSGFVAAWLAVGVEDV